MVSLSWDQPGTRVFQTGVDRGVLYPMYGPGVPWTGLVSVKERTEGDDAKAYYLNGRKTQDVIAFTDYGATIMAFSAPAEFRASDGIRPIALGLYVTQQPRMRFGFSYRTKIYNDLGPAGYKIHLVYNAIASPTDRSYSTLGDSVDPIKMTWDLDTVPPVSDSKKASAHLIIPSTAFAAEQISALEDVLYGTESTDPFLPTQSVVETILGG